MRKDNFIFVSASDGNITIYGKNDNTYYHTLKLHSKIVLDFDIHKTGKLLVSAGGEGKLKLTDLATMADAYHKNIKTTVDFLKFTNDDNILIVSNNKIIVFDSSSNTEREIKKLKSSIKCVSLEEDGLLVVSDESGFVHFGILGAGASDIHMVSFEVYQQKRVKQFKVFREDKILVSMSTEGFITVWDLEFIFSSLEIVSSMKQDIELPKMDSLYDMAIESRLICMDARMDKLKPSEAIVGEPSTQETVKLKTVIKEKKGFVERLISKGKKKIGISSSARKGARGGLQQLRKLRFISKLKELKQKP